MLVGLKSFVALLCQGCLLTFSYRNRIRDFPVTVKSWNMFKNAHMIEEEMGSKSRRQCILSIFRHSLCGKYSKMLDCESWDDTVSLRSHWGEQDIFEFTSCLCVTLCRNKALFHRYLCKAELHGKSLGKNVWNIPL